MSFDMNRVAAAALDAALNDEKPLRNQPRRHRLSGVRAIAAGAALAAAARLALTKAPSLPHVPRVSDLTDAVRDRLADRGLIDEEPEADEYDDFEGDDEDSDADEYGEDEEESDEPDPEPEADAEPEDEEEEEEEDDDDGGDDEDYDDYDDEPDGAGVEADAEEDWDDAPEDDGSPPPALDLDVNGAGERTRMETPDLLDVIAADRSPPPVVRGARGRSGKHVNPATRPPEPPPERERASTRSKGRG